VAGDVARSEPLVLAGRLAELREDAPVVAHVDGHTVALVLHGGRVYAVDNRCPHMGFPLHRGTCSDGILTCHWHHARFDLETGGTFDPWADDLRSFPVEVRDGEIWIDTRLRVDVDGHQRQRLGDGLERDLPLVIAKAILVLDKRDTIRAALEFGTRFRQAGWGRGLTILACMANLLPRLDEEDSRRALLHGVAAVAEETAGEAPRFPLRALPGSTADTATLERWLRRFIEVRDTEGAERCLVSAVRAGASSGQLAEMLFAAATDHRYVEGGHALDFANKALEALDVSGWDLAEPVLSSLARGLAHAERMEESNSWRHPVDLVTMLEAAFAELPAACAEGERRRGAWAGRGDILAVLLGDDPKAIMDALLAALRAGASEVEVASAVSCAAALRIAHFPTSNEFFDWDTALHSFTFANAVEQGLRRAPSTALLRGVFDAATTVYLNRFLNVPSIRLPAPERDGAPEALLAELPALLDHRQQVDEAAHLVARYVATGGDADRLLAKLGHCLLREDRDFHTIQMVEGASRQSERLGPSEDAGHTLVAAARYLAAHAPTARAQEQTFRIALRLHRREDVYEKM
jgi:nitrite reductase/ring-hydroxylating ferredoxin subunit